MAETRHTFGPTCAFHEDRTQDLPIDAGAPLSVKAQFFYISAVPIDDPLSPVPSAPTDKSNAKHPPQPFSVRDNAALEEAWWEYQKHERLVEDIPKSKGVREIFSSFPKFRSGLKSPTAIPSTIEDPTSGNVAQDFTSRGGLSRSESLIDHNQRLESASGRSSTELARKEPFNGDNTTEQVAQTEPSLSRRTSLTTSGRLAGRSRRDRSGAPPRRGSQVVLEQDTQELQNPGQPVTTAELEGRKDKSNAKSPTSISPTSQEEKKVKNPGAAQENSPYFTELANAGHDSGSDMSGRPFARAPSHRKIHQVLDGAGDVRKAAFEAEDDARPSLSARRKSGPHQSSDKNKAFVPVGVSRLHLVEVPDLMMKPIYWNPINDQAAVIRATWFFKDTMMPVSSDISNLLEIGYEDLKPYLDSYQDELNACIENGAAAERKIVHKLWQEDKKPSRPATALEPKPGSRPFQATDVTTTVFPAARRNAAADPRTPTGPKLFETHGVVYVDAEEAQILKPSLLPSESRGRRPLKSVRRGQQIGVAVVRGFNRDIWERLHPRPNTNSKAAHAKVGAYMSQSGDAATRDRNPSCPACRAEEKLPKVSDLVLVIHGIGQKLSERVDSYHFTHAMNGLRREFNVELATEAVQGNLRPNTGIMVLPVNWRLTVTFDSDDAGRRPGSFENKYSLQDIVPDTLPAVRPIISDVMLDIPYYLSQHKDKMTSAVIKEANRVYRLWCRNNPGFQDYGRVHILAHSLGTAMAVDILSNQPTRTPENLDLIGNKPSDKVLEFDTKNLFCCGSPAGFFLLLNNANLIPRKGRNKPGMESEDIGNGIAGEAGTYGCVAVDNVYNILHRYDPVAVQQNACVDRDYAASLMPAIIPPATRSFLSTIGRAWQSSPSVTAAYDSASGPQRPSMTNYPSTVEMSIHDFTREEIAEKRFFLLNENGQIDYLLDAGSAQLPYFNMLSAHSSYWLLKDFVRFLVVEIGRRPGRAHTLPALRAQKKREYKRDVIA